MEPSLSYIKRRKRKCLDAIEGIIVLMKKNGIEIPSKYQKSRVVEDLPDSPTRKAAEVFRRTKYLEPQNIEHIESKLKDLLAYAEVAKELQSELIAIIVLSKLRAWENLLLNPDLAMPTIPPPSPGERARLLQVEQSIRDRNARLRNILDQHFSNVGRPTRTTTLPPQVLPMPPPGPPRIDIEAQRERDIAQYAKQGAIRKTVPGDSAKTITLPPQVLPMPPLGPPRIDIEAQRERDIAQYAKQGAIRKTVPGNSAKTTTLPPQILPMPPPGPLRVDIEAQSKEYVERYRKYGEISKKLHELPNFERDLVGARLPGHALQPPTALYAGITQPAHPVVPRPIMYKNLEKQREVDRLKQQLRQALVKPRKNPADDEDSDEGNDEDNNQ